MTKIPGFRKSDIGICVCWSCKGQYGLRKCNNEIDYICERCIPIHGLVGPDIGNQSVFLFNKKKEEGSL